MTQSISRRDFLKVVTLGTATAAVLSGCGSAARYVTRQPYPDMPEYTLPGQSTYYATTCRECPAGCGLIVRTVEGRAIKVEGNPNHPVSRGRLCGRGLASIQGLYNPDRITQPGKPQGETLSWEAAIEVVKDGLQNNAPGEIAFLLGMTPDHLYDLVKEITSALGAPTPLRFGALGAFEGRATLVEAASHLFGVARLPTFDLAQADVILSFGASFMETWISPVAYSRAYGAMRQGTAGRRGILVSLEPRMSLTAANADEWFPVRPGTEGQVALALGRLAAEKSGAAVPAAFAGVDVAAAAQAAGIAVEDLERLAALFATASRRVAIPGGAALSYRNGLETAQAILGLNALTGISGNLGEVYFPPASPVGAEQPLNCCLVSEIGGLVERMKQGQIKTLLIHGVNPLFELPKSLGFAEALKNVPLVISFASFPDETAQAATYNFPDHTPLEAWGYQRVPAGADRATISAAQPVIVPLYDTKSTADVLLAAVQAIGGELADKVGYATEVDFLQQKIAGLIGQGGAYDAGDPPTLWSLWLQNGGWWPAAAGLEPPTDGQALTTALSIPEADIPSREQAFYLHIYPSPNLGDGSGANRPWLQETPDPMTTGMWGNWVEINPQTADELGLSDDDVVQISSDYGALEASVYRYPGIRPDTVAIPFGQGHTALGRYAEKRGVNPLDLVPTTLSASGDLAYGAVTVKIIPTGRKQKLARYESRVGVYGDEQ